MVDQPVNRANRSEGRAIFAEVRRTIREIRRASGLVQNVWLSPADYQPIRLAYCPAAARAMEWTGAGYPIHLFEIDSLE